MIITIALKWPVVLRSSGADSAEEDSPEETNIFCTETGYTHTHSMKSQLWRSSESLVLNYDHLCSSRCDTAIKSGPLLKFLGAEGRRGRIPELERSSGACVSGDAAHLWEAAGNDHSYLCHMTCVAIRVIIINDPIQKSEYWLKISLYVYIIYK